MTAEKKPPMHFEAVLGDTMEEVATNSFKKGWEAGLLHAATAVPDSRLKALLKLMAHACPDVVVRMRAAPDEGDQRKS